jgi:hypothetical protein
VLELVTRADTIGLGTAFFLAVEVLEAIFETALVVVMADAHTVVIGASGEREHEEADENGHGAFLRNAGWGAGEEPVVPRADAGRASRHNRDTRP